MKLEVEKDIKFITELRTIYRYRCDAMEINYMHIKPKKQTCIMEMKLEVEKGIKFITELTTFVCKIGL